MPELFSSEIIYLNPTQITINRDQRQRTEIDTTDIIDSIRENGVINPIIVKYLSPTPQPSSVPRSGHALNDECKINLKLKQYLLIAGERRLESCRELNILVPCRLYSSLDQLEIDIIEYEENRKRKDLPWRDECRTVNNLHQKMVKQNGSTQTIDQTAKSLSLPKSFIQQCLKVAKYLNEDLKILDNAQNLKQASGLLDRFHIEKTKIISNIIAENPLPSYLIPDPPTPQPKIKEMPILSSNIFDDPTPSPSQPRAGGAGGHQSESDPITIKPEPTPPPNYILNLDFISWIQQKESETKFNFMYLDINIIDINIYLGACSWLENETYIMLWYKTLEDYKYVMQKILNFNLTPAIDQPLIWFKPDIKEYESALVFRHNAPKLNLRPYIYPAPTSTISTDKKPESMLRFFFSKILTKNTNFFDPLCGNGSSLRAADSLDINSIFGLESDKSLAKHGNELIQRDRLLRKKY